MPKVGMEGARRTAVVEAAITEIARKGNMDITVTQIADRAGMSSGLVHHYFGGKDQVFLAAMRRTLSDYGVGVRAALRGKSDHRQRLVAIIESSFSARHFRKSTIAAWLNFYVYAQVSPEASRLLHVYRARLRSNLLRDLRPLLGDGAEDASVRLSGLIDGMYLHSTQSASRLSGQDAARHVIRALDNELRGAE